MTLMISLILRELSSIRAIVLTASATTAPPRSATSRVPAANWLACWAFAAFFFTGGAICSIEAEVCNPERQVALGKALETLRQRLVDARLRGRRLGLRLRIAAALFLGLAPLLGGLPLQPDLLDRRVAEHQHRPRHVPD